MTLKKLWYLIIIAVPMELGATEVQKSAWIERMKVAMPVVFCESEQYFRQCFNVSAQQCEETVTSAVRVCIGRFESAIPEVLQQPQDGTRWGNQIGRCVGTAYDDVHSEEHTRQAECFDASRWSQ